MQIHENGDVTFTRNEMFIYLNGTHGLGGYPANDVEALAAVMIADLPPYLERQGYGKHCTAAQLDIGGGGSVGIFAEL